MCKEDVMSFSYLSQESDLCILLSLSPGLNRFSLLLSTLNSLIMTSVTAVKLFKISICLKLCLYFAPTKPSLLDMLSLVASALKIERANDGCVGRPAGSPWSRFKQSFSVQGMCVCVCVCVCVSAHERASIWECRCLYVPMVHLFWILSALSTTTHKPPWRVEG